MSRSLFHHLIYDRYTILRQIGVPSSGSRSIIRYHQLPQVRQSTRMAMSVYFLGHTPSPIYRLSCAMVRIQQCQSSTPFHPRSRHHTRRCPLIFRTWPCISKPHLMSRVELCTIVRGGSVSWRKWWIRVIHTNALMMPAMAPKEPLLVGCSRG